MATTPNRNYPLPDETKTVAQEFETLRDTTLPMIDADVDALSTEVAGKADEDHGHEIADVTGLGTALDGKMPANTTFALSDLTDVSGVDEAPDGYVMVKVGDDWLAQTALSALGDHHHLISEVDGLEGALDGLGDEINDKADALATANLFNGGAIHAATAKATPADADEWGFWDSVSGALRKLTWANIVTKLVGVFARTSDVRRNLSVNASLNVSQENGDTLGATTGYYYADQHVLYRSGTLGVSVQRVAYVSLAGAKYAGEFKCTTAKTTLGATDLITDTETIEGSRPDWVAAGWGAVGARQFMYRKEVQKPAGLYHFHFSNSAGNRHCSVPYTITAGQANAKTVVEIVVPGDTSGTWLKVDGVIGLVVDDVLVAGSTYVGGSVSTWGGAAYYAASTQANFLSSTSNIARHTDFGLRLDPNSVGVYGAYQVGEVDATFNPSRYVSPVRLGSLYAGSTTGVVGVATFGPLCKPVTALSLSVAPITITDGYSTVPIAATLNAAISGNPKDYFCNVSLAGFTGLSLGRGYYWAPGTERFLALARLS